MFPETKRWEKFVTWRPTKGFILRSRRELLHQHVRALHQSRLASRCDLLTNSIRYTYMHIISNIYYYLSQSYDINFSAQRGLLWRKQDHSPGALLTKSEPLLRTLSEKNAAGSGGLVNREHNSEELMGWSETECECG